MKRLSLRTTLRPNSRRLGLTLAFCAMGRAAQANLPPAITLDGADVTQMAAPMERNSGLMVNVSALASSLGLRVVFSAGEWSLWDSEGAQWKTRAGQSFLEGATRRLLSCPTAQQGLALYLPIEEVAELAGARFSRDALGVMCLILRKEETVSGVSGWQGFTLDKPAEERDAANDGMDGGKPVSQFAPRLPASHDNMTLGLGFGYGQNQSTGLELTGEGHYLGANVRFASQIAPAAGGLRMRNPRFLWEDQTTGRTIEAGSVYSDLMGGASGVRYAWNAGKDHRPALSLYQGAADTSAPHTTLAFHDDFHLLRNVWVGGEAASDGSLYFQGQFHTRRIDSAYYARHLTTYGNSTGGLFSYDLGRGISLYAEISHLSGRDAYSDWRSIGVRLPITRFMDLTLEKIASRTNSGTTRSNALMTSLLLGPVRLYTRYQWHNASLFSKGQSGSLFGFNSQEMQTSAIYSVNPRLRFELQMHGYGSRNSSESVTTAYHLSNRTQMQFTMPFAQAASQNQYLFRLEHQLSRGLALTLDYGFALGDRNSPSVRFGQGWSLALRSRWTVATPTHGAEVPGEVRDAAGLPVRGVIVQLGAYAAQTDAKGHYVFRNVPAGEYELSLVESSLPADCKAAQPALHLTLGEGSHKRTTLKVLPLHTISGRVLCEKSDGSVEASDMNGIALSLDGFVTSTGKDGAFTFYNLPPGQHIVRLLVERLPEGLVLNSPAEIAVELPLDQLVSDLVFRTKRQDKEIIFQESP